MDDTPHLLFNQLLDANPSAEAICELYEDLRKVVESPFSEKISEATTLRGCVYILPLSDLAN